MDISKFDDSTIPDVDVYFYENTDEIDLHEADDKYRDIEWDIRLLSKLTEKALERHSQILQRHVDERKRELNARRNNKK